MGKPFYSQADYLEALVKAYQYLAGLISDREVWVELEKVLTHYFKADLVGFLGRRPDGEIVLQHLSRLEQATNEEVVQKSAAIVSEVLESGFLATEILPLPQAYAVAFLPVSERNLATRVMLVGHRTDKPLPRPLLDVYLALAGLCGATLERLASERRVQRMTEKVPEMLFELLVYPDGSLQFTYVSRQSRTIFAQPPDALLDNPNLIFTAMHPDDRPGFLAILTGAAAEGQHLSKEIRCLTPAGQERYILFHAQAGLQEDGGKVLDGAFLDITERKQAEEEVRKLNEELEQRVKERTAQLEEANKELESFAYSVSHDLRAPLRAIDGFSRILLEDCKDQLDEAAQGYLERITAGSKRMGQLIDDILKLSRLSRTEMTLYRFDLSAMVRGIAVELQEAEPERRVEIIIEDNLMVSASQRLLRVALVNLLENAWKFSTTSPRPRIEFGSNLKDGERYYFVRDNGPGFKMDYANKIFKPFERLYKESEFPGTGIGLSIVKRIIQRHGGRVWVESAEGQGATFYFSLKESK
ncbi:MAG: ATP-binding protein [Deltaproteobacteria bacterium]|nr:ATP-binding protein [Deltaproteobacteria bacterium]